MNNNSITLSITKGKGVQMSNLWQKETINEMVNHLDDINLNKIGEVLDNNIEIIEKYICSVDKSIKEILIIKLNNSNVW
jgi:hypothetical protein